MSSPYLTKIQRTEMDDLPHRSASTSPKNVRQLHDESSRRERESSRSSHRRTTSSSRSSRRESSGGISSSRSPKRESSRSSHRRRSGDSKSKSSRSRSSSRHHSSSRHRTSSERPRPASSSHSRHRSSRPDRRNSADVASSEHRKSSDPLPSRSSHERLGSGSSKSTSQRHRSTTKPGRSRSSSIDSMLSVGTMGVLSEDEEKNIYSSDDESFSGKNKRILPQQEGGTIPSILHGDDERTLCTIYSNEAVTKPSKEDPKTQLVSCTPTTFHGNDDTAANAQAKASKATLYGSDADAKAKAKASKDISGEPSRMPGVQQVTSNSTHTLNTLYGSDADAKARAKASFRAEPARNVGATLYPDEADAKAKARASSHTLGFARKPGVETIAFNGSAHTAVSTLYGSDADSQAKAKASTSPYVYISSNSNTVEQTLYGSDADANANAKARATNRGVDSVSLPAFRDEHEDPDSVAKRLSTGSTDLESQNYSGDPHPINKRVSPLIDSRTRSVNNMDDGFSVPNDPEAPRLRGAPDDKGIDDEEQKWKRRSALVLFLLLLVGVAIALWLLLFKTKSNDQDTQIRSSLTQNSTGAPSAAPSGIGFLASSSPTETQHYENLWFQPPSKDNCEKIALNETITGREDMQDADFSLGLDVALSDDNTMTDVLLQQLLRAIQEKILPSLAGCNILAHKFVDAWHFVIFNAFVNGNVETGERCKDEDLATQNCHLVSIQLDLFLKGQVRFLDIIDLISDEEENITNSLGLPDTFSVAKLIQIDNLTPTESPSTGPSDVPSSSPSEMPTPQDSTNPTWLPTATPTKYVSGVPTRSLSVTPSLAPSMVPTTSFPTMKPSIAPTELSSHSPSASPSEKPSTVPSVVPSTSPSANPTESPLARPSFRPSNVHSRGPTAVPSGSPMGIPSVQPTISPAPSSVPSPRPSGSPSASPSSPRLQLQVQCQQSQVFTGSHVEWVSIHFYAVAIRHQFKMQTTSKLEEFQPGLKELFDVVPKPG